MPSPSYNLVKDDQDIRVPMYSDEEFFNGICFQAKVSSKGLNCLIFTTILLNNIIYFKIFTKDQRHDVRERSKNIANKFI